MGAENKYITNLPTVLSEVSKVRTVQLGIVASVDDPNGLGRIKIRIPGQPNVGGDADSTIDELPWATPMESKFFTSQPKVGEGVFVLTFSNQKAHSDIANSGAEFIQHLQPISIWMRFEEEGLRSHIEIKP